MLRTFLITCCFVFPGVLFSQLINTSLVKREAFVEDSLRKVEKRRSQHERFINDSIRQAKEYRLLAASLQDTLYTWTRKEQIDQLRKNKVLLTKSRSEKKGTSLFDAFIRDSSFKNNPLMNLLCEDRFAKKRFAWTDSWATLMGWRGETYGDQLIQVVLQDSAILGELIVMKNHPYGRYKLTFVDYKGRKLEEEEVMRNKHRIAAVRHTTYRRISREVTWHKTAVGTFARNKEVWHRHVRTNAMLKEYVILNESMIKSWNYGTPSIKEKMDAEIEFLELVNDSAIKHKARTPGRKNGSYHLYVELNGVYFDKLSFTNKNYDYKKKRIRRIVKKMRKAKQEQGEALSS